MNGENIPCFIWVLLYPCSWPHRDSTTNQHRALILEEPTSGVCSWISVRGCVPLTKSLNFQTKLSRRSAPVCNLSITSIPAVGFSQCVLGNGQYLRHSLATLPPPTWQPPLFYLYAHSSNVTDLLFGGVEGEWGVHLPPPTWQPPLFYLYAHSSNVTDLLFGGVEGEWGVHLPLVAASLWAQNGAHMCC